jgi:hypothetical protein
MDAVKGGIARFEFTLTVTESAAFGLIADEVGPLKDETDLRLEMQKGLQVL